MYYDNYSIHKGAYHRNRFKYALNPFEVDSLDNFVMTELNTRLGIENRKISLPQLQLVKIVEKEDILI